MSISYIIPLCILLVTFSIFSVPIFLLISSNSRGSIVLDTVKVTAKKGSKKVSKTLTSKVSVINAGLKFTAAPTDMAVGTEEKVAVKKCPSVANVTLTSSDEAVATVAADGTVKALKAGKVTITATSDYGKSVTTDINVKKAILKDATQTEVTKVVATVAGDTTDLKAGDFKVTNTATNATVAVKSATADKKDASKIIIETFTEMKDAKEYSVVYDGVTVKFTATDGTPAKVGLDTVQIPAGSKEKVQATLLDANGVILSRTDLNNSNSSKGQVTSAVTLTKGYQDGTNLYLPAVGDTASVKVTYHTGTFGTDGKESGLIEDTFTVTAVDPSLVNYNFALTISNVSPVWTANSFKANDKIPMGADKSAYFRITKDDGSEIAAENYADYTVESADKTKLIVNNTKLSNSSTSVAVHGVAEGTTYILVKKDDKTVASLPVTVLGKPVATTLDLSKTSISVCTGSAVEENIAVTVKDQYGDAMTAVTPTVSLLAAPKDAVTVTASTVTSCVTTAAGKVTIKGQTFAADDTKDLGSYTLKITAKVDGKELTRSLNVNVVKNAAKAQSYEVRIDNPEVDTTVGNAVLSDSSNNIKISVARMANGGAMTETNKAIYTIKNAKGDVVANVGETVSSAAVGTFTAATDTVSCAAVSSASGAVDAGGYSAGALTVRPYNVTGNGTTADSKIVKNLPAGTYTVQAKVLGDDDQVVTVNGSFTIKDTQDTRASFNILNNKFEANTIAQGFADKAFVKVYYDGQLQDITDSEVTDIKGVALSGSNKGGAYIKTLKLYVKVAETVNNTTPTGKYNYVQITLNVNDQIATSASNSTDITE